MCALKWNKGVKFMSVLTANSNVLRKCSYQYTQLYGYIQYPIKQPVLPKHTLFKVLYFILAKFKNHTLFILFFSQIL